MTLVRSARQTALARLRQTGPKPGLQENHPGQAPDLQCLHPAMMMLSVTSQTPDDGQAAQECKRHTVCTQVNLPTDDAQRRAGQVNFAMCLLRWSQLLHCIATLQILVMWCTCCVGRRTRTRSHARCVVIFEKLCKLVIRLPLLTDWQQTNNLSVKAYTMRD